MSKTRVWMCFGLILLIGCFAAGSANAGLFGLFKGKSGRAAASAKMSSLLVFPLDQIQETNAPATMGQGLASALRSALMGNKKYTVVVYKEGLAPIKRAREDSTLKPKEDIAPFSEDRSKPLKLADLLAADYFAIGAIEDVQVDSAKKSAQMTLSMDLVDAKTGKLVKAVLVTGRTPEDAASSSEEDAIALAAGDAVAKLKVELLQENKTTEVAAPKAAANKPVVEAPKAAASQAPRRDLPAAPRRNAPGRPEGSPPPAPPAPAAK